MNGRLRKGSAAKPAILLARLAYDAPVIQARVGALVSGAQGGVSAPVAPALMYAGVRG